MTITFAMLLSFMFTGVLIEFTNSPGLIDKGKRNTTFDDDKYEHTGDACTGRDVETMNLQSQ